MLGANVIIGAVAREASREPQIYFSKSPRRSIDVFASKRRVALTRRRAVARASGMSSAEDPDVLADALGAVNVADDAPTSPSVRFVDGASTPIEDEPADDAERDALEAFRERLAKDGMQIPRTMSANGGEPGVCLRFLRARKLKVEKALKMLRDCLAWREANDVDAILDEPLDLEEFKSNARMYPASYHGRDVLGRPVYIERTGSAKFADLVKKLGHDGFVKMHLRAMEYQSRVLLPSASADAGRLVSKMCNVIDVGELSLYDTVSHSEVLAVLREIAQIDQDYYPENLGVTLVVAAPWSFTAAWSVVKVFLDAKTAAKFKVLGPGKAGVEKLTKVLGEGKVPAFLGGTCVCAGGCVCCDPRTGETADVLTTGQVEYARFAVERSGTRSGDGEVGGSNPGGGAEAAGG